MRDYKKYAQDLRRIAQFQNCFECYEGERTEGSCSSYCTLNKAADAIEELLAVVPQWISVEDELPENHKNVLCCGAKGGMFVGWVSGIATVSDGKTTAFAHGGKGRCITNWMPLPEPPKEVLPNGEV